MAISKKQADKIYGDRFVSFAKRQTARKKFANRKGAKKSSSNE